MSDRSAYKLSQHFSSLINREVAFVPSKPLQESKSPQIYGVYSIFPSNAALVIKADLRLFGSFAGALVGLPDSEVDFRLKSAELDELLSDAMREVFNVAAPVVAKEGRAVFKSMVMKPVYLRPDAEKALNTPLARDYFSVEIDAYDGGRFAVFE